MCAYCSRYTCNGFVIMRIKNIDLTEGNITKKLWAFALPLMFGNVLQQLYNLVDTFVVGKYIGENALAAVGSSYTLVTFLTSVIIGLCLGAGAFISMAFGSRNNGMIRNGIFLSFILIFSVTVVLAAASYIFLPGILGVMNIPDNVKYGMTTYMLYSLAGLFGVFLYNYISGVLRGIGNSAVPLLFLSVTVVLNIVLDLYFVCSLGLGIAGAAAATMISQYISGIGIVIYFIIKYPEYRVKRCDMKMGTGNFGKIMSLSGFTCLQQSVMNFGILMVQGVVNSFGTDVMAAFTVAVKIDTIAYMPVQDFGNAFSIFVAQNYGAEKSDRITLGIKKSLVSVVLFCVVISTTVCIAAPWLMRIFVDQNSVGIINTGVRYLRIEGAFYVGIGILFMLYGYYRAVNCPVVSVILTVISLGTRVLLANVLSGIPSVGVVGIWVSIPIGWVLADLAGIIYYFIKKSKDTVKIRGI